MKMKKLTIAVLIFSISALSAATLTVYASEDDRDEKQSDSYRQGCRMGSWDSEEMSNHMEAMHAQMQAIHAEKDPEKRRILMQAHRQSMHEGMRMMHGRDGNGRMGMMHRGNKSDEQVKGKMDEHARLDRMEHRMETMHKMMEQMMQHDDVRHRHMRSIE